MVKPVRLLSLLLALLVAHPGPAAAQIYSWRDASGNLVASDHPPVGADRSYKVTGTSFRATRPVIARYAGAYDHLIAKHAATYLVPPDLVRAVIQVESGFNPRAVSRKGAMGLMQLMPATAIEMGVGNPFDPDENIRGGVAYLRQLMNRYPGNVELALAAYNAGPEAVNRHGYRVPPFRETRSYVAQLSGRVATGASAPRAAASNRSRKGATRAASASPSAPPAVRIYQYWERTPDGRMIRKFSDTKPASGTFDVMR